MIVQCGKCQTRFRVADERVTPRGLKVRCSRCGETFVARRAPGEPAAPHRVEAGPGPVAPERLDAGFVPSAPPPAPITKVAAPEPLTSARPVLPPPEPSRADLDSLAAWMPPSRTVPPEPGPVPDLPGLPGLPWAEPVRSSAAIPAAPPPAPAPAAPTSTPVRRAAARPPPARRREPRPSGGPAAAVEVAIGAVLLAALAFGAAAGLAPAVPGEGAAARAWRVLAGRDAASPELLPEAVHGGLREDADGARVLYVGGEVRSRRGNPAVPIVVAAEAVDRAGVVIARAEAPAGRDPDGPGDDAPEPLAAGEAVPFLIRFDGVPAGIAGAGIRVTARFGEAGPEAPAAGGVSAASP